MHKNIGFKTRMGLELFRTYRHFQTKIHELNYLFWECTLRCNLKCIHCGSDCKKDSTTPDMPLSDFLPVLDDVAKEYNPNKVMLVLSGGEPLMRSDLEKCGEQFYKRGFPWGIVTNGQLLNSKRLKDLQNAGLRSVTVSLDGLASSHNWMRGNINSYSKAIDAIKNCSNANDLIFDVVTCVNQRSISELPKIKEMLIELNVKQWRLFTVFPRGRAATIDELSLSNDDFTTLMDFIINCREENKIIVSYGCEGFLGNYEGKVRDNFFFCRAGISVGSVLADGSISACPSMRSDFIQGNIYKDNFLECWHQNFKDMRDRSWTKSGECADCKEYKWCNGNGLHLREGKDSKLMFCHLKKIQGGN